MVKRDKVIGNLAEHIVVITANNCVLSARNNTKYQVHEESFIIKWFFKFWYHKYMSNLFD